LGGFEEKAAKVRIYRAKGWAGGRSGGASRGGKKKKGSSRQQGLSRHAMEKVIPCAIKLAEVPTRLKRKSDRGSMTDKNKMKVAPGRKGGLTIKAGGNKRDFSHEGGGKKSTHDAFARDFRGTALVYGKGKLKGLRKETAFMAYLKEVETRAPLLPVSRARKPRGAGAVA